MPSSTIFDTVNQFQNQYEEHKVMGMMAAKFQGKPDAFKKNTETNKKIQQIYNKANQSIEEWVQTPESWTGRMKNKVRNLLHQSPTCTSEELSDAPFYYKPFKWLGRKVHNLGDMIAAPTKKKPASEPYKFGELDDSEMSKLESKAKLIKTVAKTCFVAGAIFVLGGLAAPLALATFMFTLPESVVLAAIIGCTVLGVAGVAGVVSYPIIKNSKAVNEYEAETNEEYKRFVEEIVQNSEGGFNLRRKDIQNGEIFKIYEEWKNSLDEELSKKNLKKLEEERQELKKLLNLP